MLAQWHLYVKHTGHEMDDKINALIYKDDTGLKSYRSWGKIHC